MKFKILLWIVLFLIQTLGVVKAQSYERKITPFLISENSASLNNPFSGGYNNIEHQMVDIDNDGDKDLFVLNSDGTFLFHENNGSSQLRFIPKPDLFKNTPIKKWFYFVDIDNDNDFDLFTGGDANTIKYFNNNGDINNYNFVLAADTLRNNEGLPILSESDSNPVFVDSDGDGDSDFHTGNAVGTITQYLNIGTAENFNFRFETNSWQNIVIIGGGKSTGNGDRHGASSIEFGDIDNDGDLDLLWGDFFSTSIYYIPNLGTNANPNYQVQSDVFPINADSLDTKGFNMPRLVDVDNDNDLDLFVSVLFDPTVEESLMFLENIGTSHNANYSLVTNNMMRSLDVGTKSIPQFVDIDGDSDLDLFIGSENNPNGSIHFYQNTGSKQLPNYSLSTKKFFNISEELSVAPAFGDIDNDGDYDLIVGKFLGYLDLYINEGDQFTPLFNSASELQDSAGNKIKLSNFIRPNLIDVDNDNDLDLVVGAFNGKVKLYRNKGTALNFIFVLDENYFNNMDIGSQSYPYLYDFNNDNNLDLLTGDRDGIIKLYLNEGNNNSPNFVINNENVFDEDFGSDATITIADIELDGDDDIFIGNIKGGLYFYENQKITSVEQTSENIIEDFKLSYFPNPFNSQINFELNISNAGLYLIKIYDSIGKEVKTISNKFLSGGQHKFRWNGFNKLGNLVASNRYYIVVKNNSRIKTYPIILLK